MLNSCVTFVADKAALSVIDQLINEEGLIDDMVVTFDYIHDQDKHDMNIYKCETDEHNWIDIYKIKERIEEHNPKIKVEVVCASTDSETYIEVISTNGNFDVYLDSDLERIEELCASYSLDFFPEPEEEANYWDEDEVDLDSDFY